MQVNTTLAKLRRGEVALGCFLRFPSAALAEYLALSGLDFVVFDGEHGPLAPASCEHLVRATELHGATPLVRVEENNPSSILRYLDTGALGCHVPGVSSAADAVRAVEATKFFPHGKRGLSASRASGFGAPNGYARYTAEANEQTQVVAHIETVEGVNNADEIAAVEGLDVLLMGTLDLSHDMGFPGEITRREIQDAVEVVAAAAYRHGKILGMVASSIDAVAAHIDAGAQYILVTAESLLKPSVQRYLDLVAIEQCRKRRRNKEC
ncbi:HpcH/HpaI aldolase family protein [Candidatus Protofrankia californiensis]|uniref:HpcH/HpaI aldolase family protein n=1 Tax=Candidatus Protofrankia californiensis TaxID=1839754 RepID=UPI0013EA737B|nr:aldolase/citrate lyase family protein [Candidatus Protofrankia californiensis]